MFPLRCCCFLLLCIIFVAATSRVCEYDGSCRHCGDGRFSFYRCESGEDCYQGEVCDGGFCCPNAAPLPTVHMQNDSTSQELEEEVCPDGSSWFRRCTIDSQCHLTREFCAEGKCCSTCSVRRRAVLDAMPSFELYGEHIPQCVNTVEGREYRPRQCLAGTQNCWCVNDYGREIQGDDNCEVTMRRRQENPFLKAQKIREEMARRNVYDKEDDMNKNRPITQSGELNLLEVYNITYKDLAQANNASLLPLTNNTDRSPQTLPQLSPYPPQCGVNEGWVACSSTCQPSCEDSSTPQCPTMNCQPGCHCLPGFVRRDSNPSSPCLPTAMCVSYDAKMQCMDPNRQYLTCGSACPISCDSRNFPRCEEKCVRGCFCRLPFVLEDGNDPLNSRCILPSQCPPSPQFSGVPGLPHPTLAVSVSETTFGKFFSIPVPPMDGGFAARVSPYGGSQNRQPDLPLTPYLPEQCKDPLKMFISCGTSCPQGCDSPSLQACSQQCVSGCFCHPPYILRNSKDNDSQCVLPSECNKEQKAQPTTGQGSGSCSDPRKEWIECAGVKCARTCTNPQGICPIGLCSPGCVCREPYVLSDANDVSSRCVLPTECEMKCDDSRKEYLTCGSSCPLGCDNRNPKHCTPCEPGCFCKNGYMFRNSTFWRTSDCVPVDECTENGELDSSTSEESTTTTTTTTTSTSSSTSSAERQMQSSFPMAPMSSKCPNTTLDMAGKACVFDSDCPGTQYCCRATVLPLQSAPQRCTCEDSNSVWAACGSLCPEYCGQPKKPLCSAACDPSCQCASGFVRLRNEVNAPCVKFEDCPVTASSEDSVAIIQDITPTMPPNPFAEEHLGVATANLLSSEGRISGRFTFSQITSSTMRIRGSVVNLPSSSHAIIIHQYGDVSDSCRRIGPIFTGSRPHTAAALGDIIGGSGTSEFIRLVDWPVTELLGRSIAIYAQGTRDLAARETTDGPLACGTIGITNK